MQYRGVVSDTFPWNIEIQSFGLGKLAYCVPGIQLASRRQAYAHTVGLVHCYTLSLYRFAAHRPPGNARLAAIQCVPA